MVAARVLDDRRAGEAHAGLEPVGVIDLGLVDALERVVDAAAAFPRGPRAAG